MSLTLRMTSEHDVAKVVDALLLAADTAASRGDALEHRAYTRLSEQLSDELDAIPRPSDFAARVAEARATWERNRAAREKAATYRATASPGRTVL